MNPVLFVERFVGISLVIVGTSHIVAARQWAAFFVDFLRQPWAGLVIGTLTLPLGLAIVLVHNVWVIHFAVITTILGWGWTIKAVLYLLIPGLPRRVSEGKLTGPKFVIAGVICLVIGMVVCFGAFRTVT